MEHPNHYEIEQIGDIKNFVFAGSAIFTLESTLSGSWYTFKVEQSDKNDKMFFVSVLRGSDNTSSYTYLGLVINDEFRLTKNSKYGEEASCYKAFNFFFKDLMRMHIHSKLKFYHLGICSKCGRPLTTPESVKIGIGPICLSKM